MFQLEKCFIDFHNTINSNSCHKRLCFPGPIIEQLLPRNICFICLKKGSWKDSSSKAVADEFSCIAIFYCTHTAILGELNVPLKGEFNQVLFWYGAHMYLTCLHCTHGCKVNEGSDQKMNTFLFPVRNLYMQHFLPFLQTKINCTRVYFS